MTEIRGTVEPGFEAVRERFERNFEVHDEVGAGFCLYVDCQKVVDLTGGVRDLDGTPYDDDTLQLVFSSTKGITATCAHMLAQRGALDLDAPVAQYWPEFAAAGKGSIPVRWLLSHEAGLVDIDHSMTVDEALDWDTVTAALAGSAPLWEPGTGYGYHALTYGWLVGEIIRRVAGSDIGSFVQDEISGPLGLDLWIGLPDEQQSRVAPLVQAGPGGTPDGATGVSTEEAAGPAEPTPSLLELLDGLLGEGNILGRALAAPGGAFTDPGVWNEPRIRAAQIPAANGVTNAASLARMYAATVSEVDGVRLLDPAALDRAIEPQVSGSGIVPFLDIPFALGFMTHGPMSHLLAGRSFGHYGAGGSLGFADPDRRIAGAYVMSKMHLGVTGDPRSYGLLKAVDQAVGRPA